MWGPYSPKIYDGTWLQLHEFEICEKFKKEVIVADNHFSWGRDHKAKHWPKFHVNYPEPKRNKSGEVETVLTKKKKSYNAAVRHARARVESPFGHIKSTWEILAKPFRGDREVHKNITTFVVGMHNVML